MSASDFEALESQFSSHLNTWYEYGLGSEYEHLAPDSAVGRMAVDLRQGMIDAAIDCDDLEQCCSTDTDRLVHADDIQAAAEASELAQARYKVFEGMYFDLEGTHGQKTLGYDLYDGYQGAVSAALKRGLQELNRMYIPEGSRSELEALNYEIAAFLSLEDGLHFTGL